MYKVLVVPHLLSELQSKPLLLKVRPDALALAQDLIVGAVNIYLRVYINFLLFACRDLLFLF
jgi:hypothetical protein